ncbi:MAG: crosslink repair DNA glycosylase YcaQ family protein [Verrucomicrobiota bacterium]
MMEQVSKGQARRMALAAGLRSSGRGKQAVLNTIEHLGYVQIDTISVIERAHHHVLWSRQPGYRPEFLDELLAKDRSVFEHWAHAVAYLPMRDYRYYLASFEAFRKPPTAKWQKERMARAKPLLKPVLKRIEEEGPLSSRDFEDGRSKKGNWWDWKPAKVALEVLFLQGRIMVSERRGFQRVYDLSERVLPEGIDLSEPDEGERAEYQIRRALTAMGLAREAEIAKCLELCRRPAIRAGLERLVATGEVVELAVKGVEGETYHALAETLHSSAGPKTPGKVRILSPFDNLTIQRERMRLLFDFDYTIECYVPEKKRRYGYFACPVLWKNRLAARIDMKADRKSGTLLVKGLHHEASLADRSGFDQALEPALADFARFNGCSSIG